MNHPIWPDRYRLIPASSHTVTYIHNIWRDELLFLRQRAFDHSEATYRRYRDPQLMSVSSRQPRWTVKSRIWLRLLIIWAHIRASYQNNPLRLGTEVMSVDALIFNIHILSPGSFQKLSSPWLSPEAYSSEGIKAQQDFRS
jgi:hypothetical protein